MEKFHVVMDGHAGGSAVLHVEASSVEGAIATARTAGPLAGLDRVLGAVAEDAGWSLARDEPNAGCDRCGTHDRIDGIRLCAACVVEELSSALQATVLDRKHRAWMEAHDPMALQQAEAALENAGACGDDQPAPSRAIR
jgi:hypothetical protein